MLPHLRIETVFCGLCDAGCLLLWTAELATEVLSERWVPAVVVVT